MTILQLARNVAVAIAILLSVVGLAGLLPSALAWRRWSKTAFLVSAGAQAGLGARAWRRGDAGPFAVALPLLATIGMCVWLFEPRAIAVTYLAPALDAAFIVTLLVVGWRMPRTAGELIEERLERGFARGGMRSGAALMARVSALDAGGIAFLCGGWRRPPPAGIAYHRRNDCVVFLALAIVALVPEAFVIELFLGGKPWWWHALDLGLHAYTIFWLAALIVSMRDRPHVIHERMLVARRGVFDTLRIPLADIDAVRIAPELDRRTRRRLGAEAAVLHVVGSRMLVLELRQPCRHDRMLGAPRAVLVVYIPVDDPAAAMHAIVAHCNPR